MVQRSGPWSRHTKWAVAAALMTLIAVLLYANLTTPDQAVEHAIAHRYDTRDPRFQTTMTHLLGSPVVPGNRVTALLNGDQAYPAMLEAIRSAKHSITLEAYIFWPGTVGTTFAEALAERARAGVATHLILDGMGSQKLDDEVIEGMRQAGVQVVWFRPVRWYNLDRVNHRTHRKLLIVDGRVGFTGGLGIADLYLGHAQDADHWRDGQFRAEGPVAAQLQAAFLDNWIETGGALLHGTDYFPAPDSAGGARAQAVHSSPGGGTENLRLMFLLAIASARRSILIGNPYFVPNTLAVNMLVEARRRGVTVEIIVPGPVTDAGLVRRASRDQVGAAARGGRADLRVPADDVPQQADGGGRLLGVGGLGQLRQPVVPSQRRGEPERVRRDVRAGAGRRVRPGQGAVEADHAGGVAEPSPYRAARGDGGVDAPAPAVRATAQTGWWSLAPSTSRITPALDGLAGASPRTRT